MKYLSNLFLLAICIITFAGCQSYGKEYKLDKKHNVYYKGDGVDEATAKKLAEYLKKESYFQNDIEATVQVIKTKDTFNLNFVVNKSKINAEMENGFRDFGGYISQNVFAGAPVNMHLCNNELETFKDLGYCKPKSEMNVPSPVENTDGVQ